MWHVEEQIANRTASTILRNSIQLKCWYLIVKALYLHNEPKFIFEIFVVFVKESSVKGGKIVVSTEIFKDAELFLDNVHIFFQILEYFDGNFMASYLNLKKGIIFPFLIFPSTLRPFNW